MFSLSVFPWNRASNYLQLRSLNCEENNNLPNNSLLSDICFILNWTVVLAHAHMRRMHSALCNDHHGRFVHSVMQQIDQMAFSQNYIWYEPDRRHLEACCLVLLILHVNAELKDLAFVIFGPIHHWRIVSKEITCDFKFGRITYRRRTNRFSNCTNESSPLRSAYILVIKWKF